MTDSQKIEQIESIVNTYRKIDNFINFMKINNLVRFHILFNNTKGYPGILDFVKNLMYFTDKIVPCELKLVCSKFHINIDNISLELCKQICDYFNEICDCMKKAPEITYEFTPDQIHEICLLYKIDIKFIESLQNIYNFLKDIKAYIKGTPVFKVKKKMAEIKEICFKNNINFYKQLCEAPGFFSWI